ncbi:hypothetical protein TCDM_13185 [Trypanosoma cruzi Dm28c]|uniref:Uncharacterized protein n=1 Tax=Trypanosoma cruzi Dm28c TaxID=1416333 RepID=V5CIZ7_TRYCR|nr:hypothetical protein TCDM_13185 [Trypanosoma cruzi Dm28c]
MEDAVLDVKSRPLPDTALARGFRHVLRREARGGALRNGAPPSATHSAPPENHMTPRPALRREARGPQPECVSTPLATAPPQMAPTNSSPDRGTAGSPAASGAKARRHAQTESATRRGQTALRNSASNRERRRCAT